MTDPVADQQTEKLVLEYHLDAEPAKVWRAISLEEYRNEWLARQAPTASDVVSVKPEQEVIYRARDDEPPFLESTVTLRISANPAGGTSLRIIHEIAVPRSGAGLKAANGNGRPLMLAA